MHKLRPLVCLLLILCAWSCDASAQEARVLEKLPDGSLIVSVEGVSYRALNAEKLNQLAEQKIELRACNDTAKLQAEKQTLLEKQIAVLEATGQASAKQIEQLAQVVRDLSATPKRSRLGDSLGLLLRLGEVGWRIYATVK